MRQCGNAYFAVLILFPNGWEIEFVNAVNNFLNTEPDKGSRNKEKFSL
jgi:hypothetical protein